MLNPAPAWRGKDAPVLTARTYETGVGSTSPLPHARCSPLHRICCHTPHAAVQPLPAPPDGCWAPPGALTRTSISSSNAWTTSERKTCSWEEISRHTVPRHDGNGDREVARHRQHGAPIPPLAKAPRAVPLCSSVIPLPLPHV